MCASPAASSVTLGFWPLADTVIGACTAAFADAAANAKRTRARAVTTPRGRQRAMRPRLSALYRDPQLPALYFGHLSGGRTVVGDGGREHLAGDIVLVSLRGERRDRLGHLRHPLAQPRAERAVVRLQLPAPKLVRLADEAQLLHVQLVADQNGEALDRRTLAVAGHDHCLAQRLAEPELALGARLAPQLDHLACDLELPLEILVALGHRGP